MCNLYSITTNQAAIIGLFRVVNRYVSNLPPMPGVFPDFAAPVVRNAGDERELITMRWGMPPPPRTGAGHRLPQHVLAALVPLAQGRKNRCRHFTFCASELLAGAASSDWPLR
jgi:putative SOS response-associated peptidase YedK